MYVGACDELRRRQQEVEALRSRGHFADHRLPEPTRSVVLVYDHQPTGLLKRLLDRSPIARYQRPEIDDLHRYTLRPHQFGRLFGQFAAVSPRYQRDVVALTPDRRPPKRNDVESLCRHPNTAEVLWDEYQSRILSLKRGPKESHGIRWRARNGDPQTGCMRPPAVVALAMPHPPGRKICPVRCIEHQGARPFSLGSPPKGCHLVHELIEARTDEIDELKFEYRSKTGSGQPDAQPDDGGLCKRRVHHPPGIPATEAGREAKDSAFGVLDVLAKHQQGRKGLQSGLECAIDGPDHRETAPSLASVRKVVRLKWWGRMWQRVAKDMIQHAQRVGSRRPLHGTIDCLNAVADLLLQRTPSTGRQLSGCDEALHQPGNRIATRQ